jgi:hypothetical protein
VAYTGMMGKAGFSDKVEWAYLQQLHKIVHEKHVSSVDVALLSFMPYQQFYFSFGLLAPPPPSKKDRLIVTCHLLPSVLFLRRIVSYRPVVFL